MDVEIDCTLAIAAISAETEDILVVTKSLVIFSLILVWLEELAYTKKYVGFLVIYIRRPNVQTIKSKLPANGSPIVTVRKEDRMRLLCLG